MAYWWGGLGGAWLCNHHMMAMWPWKGSAPLKAVRVSSDDISRPHPRCNEGGPWCMVRHGWGWLGWPVVPGIVGIEWIQQRRDSSEDWGLSFGNRLWHNGDVTGVVTSHNTHVTFAEKVASPESWHLLLSLPHDFRDSWNFHSALELRCCQVLTLFHISINLTSCSCLSLHSCVS